MIRVRNLSVDYGGQRGVFDISLDIVEGDAIALVGPSGCGKTTLLHAMAGFLEPSSGRMEFTGSETRKPRIGLVQQQDALFPWLSAAANVELGFGAADISPDESERRILLEKVFDELGISDTMNRRPGLLSGGQRQRVSIARALIGQPDLMLMDEPTSSLDAFGKESLQNLILHIREGHPVSTVFVTHDIEEALFLAGRILVMGQGFIHKIRKNPLFPGTDVRSHREFYDLVRSLRDDLDEVRQL